MGGHNFWEGLFDTVNIGFIRNLFQYRLANYSELLLTTIVPPGVSEDKYVMLEEKEEKLRKLLVKFGVRINFYHIQGRTVKGLLTAVKEIQSLTKKHDHRFIWANNYFNCAIGVLIKKRLPNTYLHFDIRGLTPEEELYYSDSNIFNNFTHFLVLKFLERINLNHADSVSVVSRRFKEYILSKYHLNSIPFEILPCYFDPNQFNINKGSREQFRKKYQIADDQKVILYSGMLQKWQKPDLLFSFFKMIQQQDNAGKFRFMMLTFDKDKALHYVTEYGIKEMIVDSASDDVLNSLYNAADIGVITRSADMVSFVSSPVKIPEYLATGNSIVLLESVGDFGVDLKNKKYALVKKNKSDLLATTIDELKQLQKPDATDLKEIYEKYSLQGNMDVVKRIINQPYEK